MTNEEALKRFKWKYNLTKDYNDPHWEGGERREHSEWVEQLEIAVNALEKQITKKPLDEFLTHPIYDSHGNYCGQLDSITFKCPTCNDKLASGEIDKTNCVEIHYCSNCGQALDWSDTE